MSTVLIGLVVAVVLLAIEAIVLIYEIVRLARRIDSTSQALAKSDQQIEQLRSDMSSLVERIGTITVAMESINDRLKRTEIDVTRVRYKAERGMW